MQTVTFKKTVTGNVIGQVYFVEHRPNLEFIPLAFSNEKASESISPGERYITFEFGGNPGDKVSIKITSPTESVTRQVTIPQGFNSVKAARTFKV